MQRYDINLKLRIVEEYENTNTSYVRLSKKYNINWTTIAFWVQKYKKAKFNELPKNKDEKFLLEPSNFIDVTNEVKHCEIAEDKTLIPLLINGTKIETTKKGIKMILEVIQNDRVR